MHINIYERGDGPVFLKMEELKVTSCPKVGKCKKRDCFRIKMFNPEHAIWSPAAATYVLVKGPTAIKFIAGGLKRIERYCGEYRNRLSEMNGNTVLCILGNHREYYRLA